MKTKTRAQVKSKWYYIFWGTATVSVVLGQLYVGTGYRALNSSMQQLGSGLAALVSGFIITKNADESIANYPWLGYIGIIAMIITLFIARKNFK